APFDLVGITADTPRYPLALQWAQRAKQAGARVILGGPHVSFLDEEALQTGWVDVVVRGEGELIFPSLVGYLEANQDLAELPGISYRQEDFIRRTGDEAPPTDLDALPFPARDLLAMPLYRHLELAGRPITSLITSRGCPFRCTFCVSSRFSGTRWRTRSLPSVLEEIEEIRGRYGFSALAFLDDNFTLDPSRVIALCQQILQRKWDLKWWCFSRPDTVLQNEEMVEAMAAAGARYVFMGIESASQPVLDSYGKKARAEAAESAVRLLRRHGIDTTASYVLGEVEETEEMIQATIRQAIQLGTGTAQFSLLTPYPGTDLYQRVRDRIFEADWSRFDCMHPTFRLDHLSASRLQELLRLAYRSFYLRPSRILFGLLSPFLRRGIKAGAIRQMMLALREG
ncbi:MAG: radical SAM protein, partial [candidate division NC10 bacterium]|nr:radical SAM protein [candidate division NC10 bacterium]